ncbi:MAG: hypothetical protein HQ450_00675 [Alcaligenaceae bacterium]|nr:hypothetical protein [Alcaligenaceae bacterium]
MSDASAPSTVTAYLRTIDREGLLGFAEKDQADPSRKGTNKVHTVWCDGRRCVRRVATNGLQETALRKLLN